MLLILANFSLFWFSQPWTLPASIYSLTVCSQNELFPSSSKDKPLFPHQSLTLILGLCRALTQTKVRSKMSTPVHALKFHIWLSHTESAEFLYVSLPSPLRPGSPSSLVCRAQLNQWHGDFLLLLPQRCCSFSLCLLALLFCSLRRDGCSRLPPPPLPTMKVHIGTQGFQIWMLDWCMSGADLHKLPNMDQRSHSCGFSEIFLWD